MYCGKGMYYSEDNQYENMATTERIPVKLMRCFFGKGHVLYTDNFYTSPALARTLLKMKTYLCGTIKKVEGVILLKFKMLNFRKVPPSSTNPRLMSKLTV